jgi:hypothetical protein
MDGTDHGREGGGRREGRWVVVVVVVERWEVGCDMCEVVYVKWYVVCVKWYV